MNTAILLIGGNIEDRLDYLEKARLAIATNVASILKESSIYETESWGFSDTNFLNQALEICTELSPNSLLEEVNEIENSLYRVRPEGKGYSSRTIDIDIIFYNNQIIDTPNLIIPHPRMHLRNFVLIPIAEISPNFIHPIFNENIKNLLNTSTDSSEVWTFAGIQ